MNLPALDRAAARRDDAAWLAEAAARDDALLIPVHGTRNLVGSDDDGTLRARFMATGYAAGADLTWLGLLGDAPVFATDLDGEPREVEGCDWQELRRALPALPAADFELLAYARALTHWHRSHRHCGACGTRTESRKGGHERACPACGLALYPRTDPAVIVIVGDDQRVLLGRQAAWDAGRFSAIAGFVEPGETLEAAVAREVFEETGIHIHPPHYLAGQPWPFPTSLMLGFHAEPASDRIEVDGKELEEARWFTRTDIVAGLTAGTLKLSTRRSISWRLLEAWFDRAGMPLAGVPGA
jgi:NAD+ diphosphatase